MFKRVASAILGLLTLCFSLFAEGTDPERQAGADRTASGAPFRVSAFEADPAIILYQPGIFESADGLSLLRRRPTLRHLYGAPLSVWSGSGGLGLAQIDQFPVSARAAEGSRTRAFPLSVTDRPGGLSNLRLNPIYSGGEVGVFYGKSLGKYSREDFETYIIGTVGNDKFQITAGASYGESSGEIPFSSR